MKATISNKVSVIGMLHIVEVRMVDRAWEAGLSEEDIRALGADL